MPELTCPICNGIGLFAEPQLSLFDPICSYCRGTGTIRTLWGRQRLIQTFLEAGNGTLAYASDYAETGYKIAEGGKGILFGNWNVQRARQCRACKALADDLRGEAWRQCPKGADRGGNHDFYYDGPADETMARLGGIAEKAGYAIEWHDEWYTCECGKAFRLQADSMSWKPSYVELGDGDYECLPCVRKDPDVYLLDFVGTTRRMTADLDLEKYGYGLVGFDGFPTVQVKGGEYAESSESIAFILRRVGIDDFVFAGDPNDQPSVYVRGHEIVRGSYLERIDLEQTVKRAEEALEADAREEAEEIGKLIGVAV